MKKPIFIILLTIIVFQQTVFGITIRPEINQIKYTSTEIPLNAIPNQKEGVCRLSHIISKQIKQPIEITKLEIQHGDNNTYRYKMTLASQTPWVNGVWIIDIVPFTLENESIETAKKKNKEYSFWYVWYENNEPKAICWARYGH